MKIVLKKDWDMSIQSPLVDSSRSGHFVGRNTELALLKNEIARKDRGSILISGYRGVGKTSLVYKALREVKKRNENTIIVLVNATQLASESSLNTSDAIKILENLIRRLYATTSKTDIVANNIEKEIKALYRKAVASKVEIKEIFKEEQEAIRLEESITDINLMISERHIKYVIFLVFWTIAVAWQFGFKIGPLFSDGSSFDWFDKIGPLVLAFPIPFGINLVIKRKKEDKRKSRFKGSAEEFYQFDNSIGNLEYDLERIHTRFNKAKQKIIYVIDELDKYKEIKPVRYVLNYFKNLFTLSNALFIFIGGEKIYRMKEEKAEEGEHRPTVYTYFTSSYFIPRPTWDDIHEYLQEIVKDKKANDKEIDLFERALCFDAKNDYWDLKENIKDKITDFSEDDHPIIKIDNINLELGKARLQKAIAVLFQEKYRSVSHSDWIMNENLQRTLLDHATIIYDSNIDNQFVDPSEDNVESEVIRYFNGIMMRMGVFDHVSEETKEIRGIRVLIRTYRFTGGVPNEPPSTLKEPMEYENRFINQYEIYCRFVITHINRISVFRNLHTTNVKGFVKQPEEYLKQIENLGFNFSSGINNHIMEYKNLTERETPEPYKRKVIDGKTEQINSCVDSMKESLTKIIPNLVKIIVDEETSTVTPLQNNSSLFGGSAERIKENIIKINPNILHKNDLSRQIMFIQDNLDKIKMIANDLKNHYKTHRIVCFVEDSKDAAEKIRGVHFIVVSDPGEFNKRLASLIRSMSRFYAIEK